MPKPGTCRPNRFDRGRRRHVAATPHGSSPSRCRHWCSFINLEAGPYYSRRNLLDTTELALQVESCSPRRLRLARPLGRVGRLRAFGRGPGRRASQDTLARLSRPVKTSIRSQPLAELCGASGREASRRRSSPLRASVNPLLSAQTEDRSAFAAACRRSLTSASSRAARSMRSCWISVRSCWVSARCCWLSARSLTAASWLAISSTVRVSSASWPATVAMSSRAVTSRSTGFYANPTVPQDRGYAGLSALALAVEAAEALSTFLSDCDPWP